MITIFNRNWVIQSQKWFLTHICKSPTFILHYTSSNHISTSNDLCIAMLLRPQQLRFCSKKFVAWWRLHKVQNALSRPRLAFSLVMVLCVAYPGAGCLLQCSVVLLLFCSPLAALALATMSRKNKALSSKEKLEIARKCEENPKRKRVNLARNRQV